MQRPALVILCLAAALPGCTAPVITGVAAVAEYGTSTFNSGALETYYPNRYFDTVVAVRRAIAELGLRPISDVPTDEENFTYIKCVDETDTEIWFRVRRRGVLLTTVSIRVDLLGNEPYATALAKHVTSLLDPDASPTTPPPNLRVKSGEHPPPNPLRPEPSTPEPPPPPPKPEPR
jgi:hypothetical protein